VFICFICGDFFSAFLRALCVSAVSFSFHPSQLYGLDLNLARVHSVRDQAFTQLEVPPVPPPAEVVQIAHRPVRAVPLGRPLPEHVEANRRRRRARGLPRIRISGEKSFVRVLTHPDSTGKTVFEYTLRRVRKRQRGEQCLACGYSLTGNTLGVCSERGTAVAGKAEV